MSDTNPYISLIEKSEGPPPQREEKKPAGNVYRSPIAAASAASAPPAGGQDVNRLVQRQQADIEALEREISRLPAGDSRREIIEAELKKAKETLQSLASVAPAAPAAPVASSAAGQETNPYAKLNEAYAKEQKEKEEKEQSEGFTRSAAAGAAAGAAARYKGKNLFNFLAPGEGVFQPSQERVEFFNERLRQATRDPAANIQLMTPAQADRLIQGGEGPTLGTTGRQRGETYNLESQRRSRVQQATEAAARRAAPTAVDPLLSAGEPMVELRNGVVVPRSVATQQAEAEAVRAQQQAERARILAEREAEMARRGVQRSALATGTKKVLQGGIGGAFTGLQGYGMATQKQPIDWSQYLSLLGGLGMTFGGPKLGVAGALAQWPYIVKHRDELARALTLGDINPTMFAGSPEALETPIGGLMTPK